MFVPGTDRVAVLFEHRYKNMQKRKINIYQYKTGTGRIFGLKCKTVNRAVKSLKSRG